MTLNTTICWLHWSVAHKAVDTVRTQWPAAVANPYGCLLLQLPLLLIFMHCCILVRGRLQVQRKQQQLSMAKLHLVSSMGSSCLQAHHTELKVSSVVIV
jgi:hypothetical protein